MSTVTLKGKTIQISGKLPEKGTKAPDFLLTKTDLSDVSLNSFEGKKIILNIFPSVDTAVCASSVRKFNEKAGALPNTVVLCVSLDLPFALGRFCGAEGLKGVVPVSEFKKKQFGESYGIRIQDGPLEGLLARAVVVLKEDGEVIYSELVPEIAQEPDYEKALNAVAST